MIFETSWDDYSDDVIKLAGLLFRYRIPATFYFEAKHDKWELYKNLKKMGFDIGCHTINHPVDLKALSKKDKENEIINSKEIIERGCGIYVTKFCYPRGRYDDECVEIVKAAGYKEATTTQVLQTKFEDAFRKPTTIHFFGRKEYQGRDLLEISKEYFDKACLEDSYFHLWGHAWEIEKLNLWGKLEELLQYISDKKVINK